MEIKNIGGFQPPADAKSKTGKRDDIQVSFMEYMRQRANNAAESQTVSAAVDTGGAGVGALYGAGEIEAITARSRITPNTGGDVTDFLGLVSKHPFLAGGADFSAIGGAALAKPLSQADLQSLREKYNADKLSPDKQLDLFRELAGLDAVTESDAQRLGFSVSPGEDDLMGYLAKEEGFTDVSAIDGDSPKLRLEAMIKNERMAYEHVRQKYGKRASAALELADSHKRVLDTLKQI